MFTYIQRVKSFIISLTKEILVRNISKFNLLEHNFITILPVCLRLEFFQTLHSIAVAFEAMLEQKIQENQELQAHHNSHCIGNRSYIRLAMPAKQHRTKR